MGAKITIVDFEEALIPGVIRFWNSEFSRRRNFVKLTPALFKERIVNCQGVVASFNPAFYLLALSGTQVVGLIHGGIFYKAVSKALLNEDNDIGFVGIVAVSKKVRRKGIGTALYNSLRRRLESAGAAKIMLDGQCLNPFYGNMERLVQPFFDTPEGISVSQADRATADFFKSIGFAPRYHAVTMKGVISQLNIQPVELPEGMSINIKAGDGYFIGSLINKGAEIGKLPVFAMNLSDRVTWGIHELQIDSNFQGRGYARTMLWAITDKVKKKNGKYLECVTVKELSPAAVSFYKDIGFKTEANWLVY